MLPVGRRQQADAVAGGAVGEPGRAVAERGALDQVALPMQLLLPLERVERLEHPEVGGRHHRDSRVYRREVPLSSRHPLEGASGVSDATEIGDATERALPRGGGARRSPEPGGAPGAAAVDDRGEAARPGVHRAAAPGRADGLPGLRGPGGGADRERDRPGANDFVWPTFRELAAAIVRGVDAVQYLQYHRGTWHGGPYDPRATRFGPINIPIATQIPHAAGYALGQKLDGTDAVTLVVLRRRRHQRGRLPRGGEPRRRLAAPARAVLPEQRVGDQHADRAADGRRDLAPRGGLRLPGRPRRRQRRARRPGGDGDGARTGPAPATARR